MTPADQALMDQATATIKEMTELMELQLADRERLQTLIDAIDALHQPHNCPCLQNWPCLTHRLIHPEGD